VMPRPNVEQQNRFLREACLSTGSNLLDRLIRTAYLDMNRRAQGIGRIPDAHTIREQGRAVLGNRLANLRANHNEPTVTQFDEWHRDTCQVLMQHYHAHKFPSFKAGHAQKWVNMTMKYLWCFGQDDPADVPGWYPFAHMPLDQYIVKSPELAGIERTWRKWWEIADYDTYRQYHQKIRERFPNRCLLDVEFDLWLRMITKPGGA